MKFHKIKTFRRTNITINIPNVSHACVVPCGANASNSINGKPKIIAGIFCNTKLLAAGVWNSLSISRSNIIPVLAVPVNIPNNEKYASYSYVGKILLVTYFK